MSWTPGQRRARAEAALNVWVNLPANGPLPLKNDKIEAGRELARVLQRYVDAEQPGVEISNDVRDRICHVIDRVKLDDRQLDTNEYAAAIEQILADAIIRDRNRPRFLLISEHDDSGVLGMYDLKADAETDARGRMHPDEADDWSDYYSIQEV